MRLKRYEIHIYDDVCVDLFNNGVLDKSINNTYKLEDLLNQQDKRIKELEEENKELEIKLDKCGTELVNAENLVSYLENENQQLKQQLHDLPKKIVEEIRDVAGDYWEECENNSNLITIANEDFDEILDTILEKFGGKDEINND